MEQHGEYLKAPKQRPSWLRVDRLLGEHGIPKDSLAGRTQFARRLQERADGEQSHDYAQIRRDWCVGSKEFRQELLAAAGERVGPNHYGRDRQETGEEKAQRIVKEEIDRLGWAEAELKIRRKGDPAKVAMARRLRRESIMSLKWIAARLQMGSWTYVSNLLADRSGKMNLCQ